ncbi:MAG: Eco57I restriction-modification methylase domain-containing protein [Verrucomicrobiota bacterium]
MSSPEYNMDEQTLLTSSQDRRHELGQFLTPNPVADFMSSLFEARWEELHLLDAGAGDGALTAALVRRLCASHHRPRRIYVTASELDEGLIESLRATLRGCQQECARASVQFSATVLNEDFIAAAVPMVRNDLFGSHEPRFNAAIVNPPYRKIRSDSATRLLLRSAGIETSNLYTGFVALITKLLAVRGELVAITPRSFCNGPYFKPFRTEFLETMSLRRLHVFESRSAAFRRDDVLQENIIVHAVKGAPKPRQVIVSSNTGATESPIVEREVEYADVVSPDDPERFIHLVGDDRQDDARSVMRRLSASLPELGLAVSTGRVVDFRAEEFLRQQQGVDTVPLIYPCHFNGGFLHWPKDKARKPNAIVSNEQTRELLVPAGVYVLVKRFTAKEERRRVVACIYDPHRIHAPFVGFENHLNYFHENGHGLPMNLAKGLAAFLNSTVVDVYFRQFNGHTQVNATDLRSLNYPTKSELEKLGRRIADPGMQQEDLDAVVEEKLF